MLKNFQLPENEKNVINMILRDAQYFLRNGEINHNNIEEVDLVEMLDSRGFTGLDRYDLELKEIKKIYLKNIEIVNFSMYEFLEKYEIPKMA